MKLNRIIDSVVIWLAFGRSPKREETIKKTPRDYALEMHGVIAGLPSNERDAALYTLIRLTHPGKHIHSNPTKKQKQQEIAA